MYYILTPYTLTIKTNLVLTSASSLVIKYEGPYYETGEWLPTASSKNAILDISNTLIDRSGTYKLRLEAVIDGNIRRSSPMTINFSDLSL